MQREINLMGVYLNYLVDIFGGLSNVDINWQRGEKETKINLKKNGSLIKIGSNQIVSRLN